MENQQKEAGEDLLKKTDEELRTLMMQALALEEIDIEYINCITDILATRHPEEYRFDEEGILDAALQIGAQDAGNEAREGHPAASKRKPNALRKMLAIAAVLVVVMMVGLVIPVQGTNLFGMIAHWTSELFSFGSSEIGKSEDNQGPLYTRSADSMVLHDLLVENGIEVPLAPTYIPEGFAIHELVNEAEKGKNQKYGAEYVNDAGNFISVSIRNYSFIDSVIEKDDKNVTIYTTDQIDHYIFFNVDSVSVTWRNDVYDCSINILGNSIAEAQIYAMIDSIYENGD